MGKVLAPGFAGEFMTIMSLCRQQFLTSILTNIWVGTGIWIQVQGPNGICIVCGIFVCDSTVGAEFSSEPKKVSQDRIKTWSP